ncbi:MAG: ABC transporter permease [Acutalibacteraceae bacterium]
MLVKSDILIASPLQVLQRLFVLIGKPEFRQSVALSFLRISCGYLSAVAAGTLLASAAAVSKTVKELFSPIIKLARSVPVASFIILALVWIRKDYVPVFIVFLIVMPVIWQNVLEGIENTDKKLVETARIYGFSFFKTIKTVYFHCVLPYFSSGCIAALGLAWKSGVAAEVLAMPVKSIGYNLYRSKINIETADLFAWTAVVIILSMILERFIAFLISRFGGKRNDRN